MKVSRKKLSLNKETVAHLRITEMGKALGGVDTFYLTCPRTDWTCYTGPPMDCKDPSIDLC